MDYAWLKVVGLILGAYVTWREDRHKKEQRLHDQAQRRARYYQISHGELQSIDSEADAETSSGDGGPAGWDLGGWAD